MSKTEQLIWNMAEPLAEANGLELVDVEFVKEGAQWFLRIFIDKEGGVDLQACEVMNRAIGEKLDQEDPIAQAYRLEVSSPGIERPLKKDQDFVRFQGEKIKIQFFSPWDGKKEMIGILGETTAQTLELIVSEDSIRIPRDKISKAHLVWEF